MLLPIFGPRINMQRKRWECKKNKKNVKENKKIYQWEEHRGCLEHCQRLVEED
jgi:hypothetical protein